MKQLLTVFSIITVALLQACGGNNASADAEKKPADTTTAAKEDTTATLADNTAKPAIINIVDTIATKQIVICIKDSAASFERIGTKLAQLYGVKLAEVLKKNNLKQEGAPMAWYKGNKAPYFFEAGIPVAKKPAKLSNGAFVKEMAADSVVIAHFFGPYNLLSQGYDALNEWLKDEKKKATGAPYEVYMGDPVDKEGKAVDPYKVRTDIVFPRK